MSAHKAQSKGTLSNALEIMILKKELAQVQRELREVKLAASVSTEPLAERAKRLRQVMQTFRLKIQRDRQLEDQFRLAALEVELGKTLLLLDDII